MHGTGPGSNPEKPVKEKFFESYNWAIFLQTRAPKKDDLPRETLEIRTIPDWDGMYGESDLWDEDLEKFEFQWFKGWNRKNLNRSL
jgi:hypothetical protein